MIEYLVLISKVVCCYHPKQIIVVLKFMIEILLLFLKVQSILVHVVALVRKSMLFPFVSNLYVFLSPK